MCIEVWFIGRDLVGFTSSIRHRLLLAFVCCFIAKVEFFTEFGEAFQYSNQLVATSGYAAAAATGAEWGNLYNGYVAEMEARVFAPIGMTNTTFAFEEVLAGDNYALPHAVGVTSPYEQIAVELERIVTPVAPAGAPWSNVLEMGRYLITELSQGVAPDGTRVVSAENLAITWEPQVPVDANLGRYRNPALGALELAWENETLIMDSGAFRMEVRAQVANDGNHDGNGVPQYVILDAPLTGLPLRLEIGEEGHPQVIFGAGVDEYTFTWLE